MSRTRRERAHALRGASLLEMMIAGLLGLFVITLGVNLFQWVGRAAARARARDRGVHELKMATDMIAKDLGMAVEMQAAAEGQLRFSIDGPPLDGTTYWGAPDRVISYQLTGDGLVRHDELSDERFVVARPFATFTVEVDANSAVPCVVVDLGIVLLDEQNSTTLRLLLP